MANITIEGLCKGWDFPVIDDLSVEIEEGEFFVVVGPSGIGKTTLLRLIAGLESADRGRILLGEREVTHLPPYRRRVAMTFESYALYPHLTVFENISSPLRARKKDRATIERRVKAVAQLLRIDHLLDRKPGQVSGGQKQRTALGRTLVADPEVFLLDEPISHLDAKIRQDLRMQFHTLEELRRVATLYVTHDYAEALSLGDRIGVMGNGGKLVQIGSARELFERPKALFVAEHLGQPTINAIPSILQEENGSLFACAENAALRLALSPQQSQRLNGGAKRRIVLGLRPQHVRPADELRGRDSEIDAQIDIFEALGSNGIIITKAGGVTITGLTHPERHFEPGQDLRLAIDTEALHIFDAETGLSLLEEPRWQG
ncbi:MAG: ABC transporter ATP-binding protein [Rhodospirillales bacterium]|nr:ABC transporter ATP-binding protein [Rhodospirillales bacterium]